VHLYALYVRTLWFLILLLLLKPCPAQEAPASLEPVGPVKITRKLELSLVSEGSRRGEVVKAEEQLNLEFCFVVEPDLDAKSPAKLVAFSGKHDWLVRGEDGKPSLDRKQAWSLPEGKLLEFSLTCSGKGRVVDPIPGRTLFRALRGVGCERRVNKGLRLLAFQEPREGSAPTVFPPMILPKRPSQSWTGRVPFMHGLSFDGLTNDYAAGHEVWSFKASKRDGQIVITPKLTEVLLEEATEQKRGLRQIKPLKTSGTLILGKGGWVKKSKVTSGYTFEVKTERVTAKGTFSRTEAVTVEPIKQ
jgi:hypothetical protein